MKSKNLKVKVINYLDLLLEYYLYNSSGVNLDKLFNKLLDELNKLHIDKTQIVVFGSTVWEYFGIREARDIDIIISNKIKKSTVGSKKNIASKEVMLNEVVGVGVDKFVNIGFEDKDFFVNSDLTLRLME